MSKIITPAEFKDSANVYITNPPRLQPDFPVFDLIEENAKVLAPLLIDPAVVDTYHEAADCILLFRVLHPKLVEMSNETELLEEEKDALGHGMKVFEAINAAVTSPNTERVTWGSFDRAVNEPDLVEAVLNSDERLRVSRWFQGNYAWTAHVIHESSKDEFAGLSEFILAGAALHHAITIRALKVEPNFV